MNLKVVINDIIAFVKHPSPSGFQKKIGRSEKIKLIFKILLFETLIVLLLYVPIYELIVNYIVQIRTPKIDYTYNSLGFDIIMVVLLLPFFEELIFRYPLRIGKRKSKISHFFEKNFGKIVYVSAIAFGLAHIFNFENNELIFYLLTPIIVSTQLLGGLLLSYIRVKIGFKWAVFYHSLFNLTMIMLSLFFMKEINIENKDYKLSIREYKYQNENRHFTITNENGQLKKIEIKQYSMQHLLDSVFPNKKLYVDDFIMDMTFETKKNTMSKEQFIKHLKKEIKIVELK